MSRLLTYLAIFSLALMGLAAVLGLRLGDMPAVKAEYERVRSQLASVATDPQQVAKLRAEQSELGQRLRSVDVHLLSGIAAAVAVLLANSIAVTYFIGTHRWCREVCDAYSLDAQFVAKSGQLKRQAFPWALAAMLAIIGVSLLGAMADPRVLGTTDHTWPTIHFIAALAAMALIATAFYVQWMYVNLHHELIGRVMAEVTRIRTERGLPV